MRIPTPWLRLRTVSPGQVAPTIHARRGTAVVLHLAARNDRRKCVTSRDHINEPDRTDTKIPPGRAAAPTFNAAPCLRWNCCKCRTAASLHSLRTRRRTLDQRVGPSRLVPSYALRSGTCSAQDHRLCRFPWTWRYPIPVLRTIRRTRHMSRAVQGRTGCINLRLFPSQVTNPVISLGSLKKFIRSA